MPYRKYRKTPRRMAALRKAQLASARKRRGSRRRKVAIGLGVAGFVVGRHVLSGSKVKAMAFRNAPGSYTGKPNFGGFMHTRGKQTAKAVHLLGGLQNKKYGFGVMYTHAPLFTTRKRRANAVMALNKGIAKVYSR